MKHMLFDWRGGSPEAFLKEVLFPYSRTSFCFPKDVLGSVSGYSSSHKSKETKGKGKRLGTAETYPSSVSLLPPPSAETPPFLSLSTPCCLLPIPFAYATGSNQS